MLLEKGQVHINNPTFELFKKIIYIEFWKILAAAAFFP